MEPPAAEARSGEAAAGWWWRWLGAAALLLGAAWLRFTAIDWGAPYVYHPDEHFIVHPALDIVRSGDPNPHWFQYPSLLIYAQAALVAALRPFVGAPLETDPAVNGIGPWDVLPEQWPFVAAGRLVVAAAACASALLLAGVGARVAGSAAAGLLAGALLMVSALHNQSSHYLTTDVPATALAIACMWAAVSSPRRWLLAGVLAGLAAGTKYTAGMVLLVPLLQALDVTAPRQTAARWARLAAGAAAGFVASTPYAVLDPGAFWSGLAQQRQNYLAWSGQEGNLQWYLHSLYAWGVGPAIAVLAVLGLGQALGRIAAAVRRPHDLGPALAFVLPPLAFLAWLSSYPSRADRNLVVILPFLCLWAASALRRASGFLRRPALAAAALAASAAVVVALSLPPVLEFNRRLGLADNRTLALDWLRGNVPRGARIAREEYTPQVSASEYAVTYEFSLARRLYSDYLMDDIDYLIASSNVYGRSIQPPYIGGEGAREFYRRLFELPLVQEFPQGPQTAGPSIRIYRVPKLSDLFVD